MTLLVEFKNFSALQFDLFNEMTRVVHPFLIINQKRYVCILLIDILSIIDRGLFLKLELKLCNRVSERADALHLLVNILLSRSLEMTILYNNLIVELLGY